MNTIVFIKVNRNQQAQARNKNTMFTGVFMSLLQEWFMSDDVLQW